MARYDLWDHDDNRGNQGENLFSGSNPLEASELWYGEYPQFPEKDNYMEHIGLPAKYVYGDDYTMDKADGHFTQVREMDARTEPLDSSLRLFTVGMEGH